MLRVTVDVFSGRPNPVWIIGGERGHWLLSETSQHRSIMGDLSDRRSGLGFRRVLVEILQKESSETFRLPQLFSIADRSSREPAKGLELARMLIGAISRDEVGIGKPAAEDVAALLSDTRQDPVWPSGADERPGETMLPLLPPYHAERFAPELWNDPAHVRTNNCYDYALNRCVDAFAQPGEASGRQLNSFAYEEIVEAAVSDGVVPAVEDSPQPQSRRSLVALFLWPGIDYHWYRRHAEGYWGHKPGPQPARVIDNSGTPIRDPRDCERDRYSAFGGFFLAPSGARAR